MADNYDGNAEAEAIIARLATVAPGGTHETLLDGESIPQDDMGQVSPFISILFGETTPLGSDNTLDRDGAQPWVLPFTLVLVAPDGPALRQISADAKKLMVDWRPSATADFVESVGPRGGMDLESKSKPSRVTRLSHYLVRINL